MGRQVGILTGGGDAPGLNAVIRAVIKYGVGGNGWRLVGIEDSFNGLLSDPLQTIELVPRACKGLLQRGGTILGTTNHGDPFHYPGKGRESDRSGEVMERMRDLGLEGLIVLGGDGTMRIVRELRDRWGLKAVGVPKTIDNDLAATDQTFGYDSAVTVVCEAIDRLNTTAAAHHRVMVVEVMGRYAGWIALGGGVAGGADVILMPEFAWDWPALLDKVNARSASGKRYSIVCVAEGAKLPGSADAVVQEIDPKRTDARRLGGVEIGRAHV